MNRRQVLAGGSAATFVAAGAVGAATWSMGSSRDYDAAFDHRPDTPREYCGKRPKCPAMALCVYNNRMLILPDLPRHTLVVDPDDHHLFASLGCAAEKIRQLLLPRAAMPVRSNSPRRRWWCHRLFIDGRSINHLRCSTRLHAASRLAPTIMDARCPL